MLQYSFFRSVVIDIEINEIKKNICFNYLCMGNYRWWFSSVGVCSVLGFSLILVLKGVRDFYLFFFLSPLTPLCGNAGGCGGGKCLWGRVGILPGEGGDEGAL